MILKVHRYMFAEHFKSIRPDNFSWEALDALYEYLTDLEESTGEQIELDVIALCCEFSEYSIAEALESYDCEDLEDLERTRSVIRVNEETVIVSE